MALNARRRPLVTDGASGIDQLRSKISLSNNQNGGGLQVASLHAEITSSTTARAAGFSARGASPVLALCRKLLAAGIDPARPLHAYRGEVLCLLVRSIAEGARLTVAEGSRDTPRFRLLKPRRYREGPPRIAQQRRAATTLAGGSP